ncbi:MAG: TonB C-terminal domain-containing protein [Deltaproteobacteria bacterium]|jgi:TonB family protein|nr:TonB C-terminal domain-containing protein [Deltaproteobacteria bacterium]
MTILRMIPQDGTEAGLFGPDRRRLALFAAVALAIHLAAFSLLDSWGPGGLYRVGSMGPPPERFLELDLELAGPPEPPAPEEAPLPLDGGPAAGVEPPPADAGAETAGDQASHPPLGPSASLVPEDGSGPAALPEQPDNTINLEDTAPQFKSYHTSVRSAVARRWILPPEARTNFQPGRFTAVMTLSRQGQILLIVVEESSGSPGLDFAAMEALRGAAPYPPFPSDLEEFGQLNFRLHFDYRAVQRRIGPAEP